MTDAPQDWLDRLLMEELPEIPDDGFSKKLVSRIRNRKRARILALGGSVALGVWLATALGAVDGLIRTFDILGRTLSPDRFSFLNKLPLPELPQIIEMPPASDFASPMVLAFIGVSALVWLIREEA